MNDKEDVVLPLDVAQVLHLLFDELHAFEQGGKCLGGVFLDAVDKLVNALGQFLYDVAPLWEGGCVQLFFLLLVNGVAYFLEVFFEPIFPDLVADGLLFESDGR